MEPIGWVFLALFGIVVVIALVVMLLDYTRTLEVRSLRCSMGFLCPSGNCVAEVSYRPEEDKVDRLRLSSRHIESGQERELLYLRGTIQREGPLLEHSEISGLESVRHQIAADNPDVFHSGPGRYHLRFTLTRNLPIYVGGAPLHSKTAVQVLPLTLLDAGEGGEIEHRVSHRVPYIDSTGNTRRPDGGDGLPLVEDTTALGVGQAAFVPYRLCETAQLKTLTLNAAGVYLNEKLTSRYPDLDPDRDHPETVEVRLETAAGIQELGTLQVGDRVTFDPPLPVSQPVTVHSTMRSGEQNYQFGTEITWVITFGIICQE